MQQSLAEFFFVTLENGVRKKERTGAKYNTKFQVGQLIRY